MARPEIGHLLGSGKMAEAFHYGEHVLKLYRDPSARSVAFGEAAILAIVGEHGLPTPAVHEAGHFAGRWGLVMDRVPGQPLAKIAETDPTLVPAALEAMVQLHLAIHAREEIRLSPLKPRLANRITHAPHLDTALRAALLARLAHQHPVVQHLDRQSVGHGSRVVTGPARAARGGRLGSLVGPAVTLSSRRPEHCTRCPLWTVVVTESIPQ